MKVSEVQIGQSYYWNPADPNHSCQVVKAVDIPEGGAVFKWSPQTENGTHIYPTVGEEDMFVILETAAGEQHTVKAGELSPLNGQKKG